MLKPNLYTYFRKMILAAAALPVLTFAQAPRDSVFSGRLLFTAHLTGTQETPPVSSPAEGIAAFTLTPGMDSLIILADVTGMNGSAFTAAHIHNGLPGLPGSVMVPLDTFRRGARIYGVLTGSKLTSALIREMIAGRTYINYHTAAHPNGEIRGQITLEKDYTFAGLMSGAQEVPAVVTADSGFAIVHVSKDLAHMEVNAIVKNAANDITNTHLHSAMAGQPGGVIFPLFQYLHGQTILANTVFGPSTSGVADSLMTGNVYLNVHTSANPGGEIRGQLAMMPGINFDALLNAGNERPSNPGMGRGLALFNLNPSMDTLRYTIFFDSLAAGFTGAHLHTGFMDSSGGILLPLTDSVKGNNLIMGYATGASITKALIRQMLRGGVYVNIHTAAMPTGEIRGQLFSDVREGYAFDLCGAQEANHVSGGYYGVGAVSMNRSLHDIHYMLAVDSLSGAATAAHFHTGLPGVSGGVISPITLTNNVVDTYLSDTFSVAGLDTGFARKIRAGGVYVNVHTTSNSAGEIRGQVVNGVSCGVTTGVKSTDPFNAFTSVYPVPFSDELHLVIDPANGNSVIRIIDMQGKEVLKDFISSGKGLINLRTETLINGLYILNMTSENGTTVSRKIMKQ